MKSLFQSARLSSQKGSVFVLVAVAAMMLVIATGTSVDMARAQVLQARLSSALDAAGLAAGATATTPPNTLPGYCGSSSWVQCQAQKYFNANFPTGYLGSGAVTVVATISGDNSTVVLSANTVQATTFLQAIGIRSVSVAANAQIARANEGMELVLVLDNTGSMANAVNSADSSTSKIDALQSAIRDTNGLLDQLYGASDTVPNLWVGVVPFSYFVNIGTSHSTWMNSTFDGNLDYGPTVTSSCPSYSGNSGTHSSSPSRCSYTLSYTAVPTFGMTNWQGCVLARPTYEETDQVPSGSVANSQFKAYLNVSTATGISSNKCTGSGNDWTCSKTTGSGASQQTQTIYDAATSSLTPNLNCIAAPVLPMTASKSAVVSEVNSMTAVGSTMINLGMAWGYRMLSPNWAGYWGGEMDNTGSTQFPQLPLPYHTALMNKVLILMTDGINSPPGGATGSAYQGQSLPTVPQLDSRTKTVCDSLKSNGVIIYTIGFGTTDDNDSSNPTSVDGDLLKYCATQLYSGDTSHYFLASTNAALAGVFQQIGASLANLRISQ